MIGQFEWFRMLMESTGTFNGWGTIARVFSYLFVEFPFAAQRLIVSIIALMISMLDFSSLFARHRRVAFDHSREIWLSFIGGSNGYIDNTSVAFFFVLIATIYLAWNFFLSRKGDFGKKAGHMIIVVVLGFAYFGTWRVDGTPTPGGIVMLNTLDNVASDIRSTMLIDFAPAGMEDTGGITGETDFASFYATHVIGTTFNFINSGSMSGEYASGQRLDMEILIPPENMEQMSASDRRTWERARENYIDDLADRNPWVEANMTLLVPRAMMVVLGFVNAVILAVPVIFVNLTITGFEVINWLLILFFPFALIISFIPFLRGIVFKVLKTMVMISFMPVLLGFLILVFFYLNQVLDSMIMEVAGLVLGTNGLTMGTMPNGIGGLSVFSVMIVVKIFLFWGAWKNKTALLGFITAGAITPNMMASIDAPTDKMKEWKPVDYVEEKYEAAKKVALGAMTGDVEAIDEGVNSFLGRGGDDKAETDQAPITDVVEDETSNDKEIEDPMVESDLTTEDDVKQEEETKMTDDSDDVVAFDDVADVKVINPDDIIDDAEIEIATDEEAVTIDMLELDNPQPNLDIPILPHELSEFDDFMTNNETQLNGEPISNGETSQNEQILKQKIMHQSENFEHESTYYDMTPSEKEVTLRAYFKGKDHLQPQTISPPVGYNNNEKTEMDLFMESMERFRTDEH